jgi:HPr kinase/phosphorylase
VQKTLHATCMAIGGHGVLLLGPPGSGKSDLALRLIDGPGRGTGGELLHAQLVSDDQVIVRREGDTLMASPPASIAGKLEVRGIGLTGFTHAADVRLSLAIELTLPERMPEPRNMDLLGLSLPLIRIDPREPSAPAKVRVAVQRL